MRVLNVNKYYQLTGGGDRFFFDSASILAAHGHEVIPFCLDYPGNLPTPYAPYFPPGVRGALVEMQSLWTRARLFLNGIYSREAARAMRRMLDKFHPDVAHLHILHYAMSPSVISALDEAGIPIVFSLHDYRVVCANGFLYRGGRECHDCRKGRFYNALRYRCYRNGFLSSLMGAVGNYLYSGLGLYKKVDVFTVPHEEMGLLLSEEFGLPASRIRILKNPLAGDVGSAVVSNGPGEGVLYFGNITPQKGVFTVVRAARLLPEVFFLICGSGPSLPELKEIIRREEVRNVRVDETTRWETGLPSLIRSSRLVVSPSEWPTTLEFSTLETMMLGKALVASRVGGNRVLVDEGVTGALFTPGDAEDMAAVVRRLYGDPNACSLMGNRAREKALRDFSSESYYADVTSIYEEAVALRSARRRKGES
jgi:glycosyltransferase involved in cell wall biosynthesis